MNKKLKTYCVLLAAVIVGSILTNVVKYNGGSCRILDGTEQELEVAPMPSEFATIELHGDTTVIKNKATLSVTIPVKRQCMADDPVLLSTVNGKTCMVEMTEAKLMIPEGDVENESTFVWYIGITIASHVILVVWLLVIVFRIIRSIYLQKVFVGKMASNLEQLGILLIAYEAFNFVCALIMVHLAQQHFALATYDIVFSSNMALDVKFVMLGLVMMIISQIILMGKELKDEQELTI